MSRIFNSPNSSAPDHASDMATGAQPEGVKWLIDRFKHLSPQERIRLFFNSPVLTSQRVLVTSSFGTTSALVLHMLKQVGYKGPIYFLNTSFHFVETIQYRDAITKLCNLDVRELRAAPPDIKKTLETGLWATDPEACCAINKVRPLQRVKTHSDIWVSGLMNWQSPTRQDLEVFEMNKGLMKFYPLVDFTEAEAEEYYKEHSIPKHPLSAQGYASVGCTHCTLPSEGRNGRWPGQEKTECGLHGR